MANLGFLGRSCTRSLGCSFLVGVSVMKLLFLALLPSSIVELSLLRFLISVHFVPGEIVRFRYDFVAVAVVVGRPFWNIASLPLNPCEGAMRYVSAVVKENCPACLVKNDLVDYFVVS